MANQIKMAVKGSILTIYDRGMPQRRIVQEQVINRRMWPGTYAGRIIAQAKNGGNSSAMCHRPPPS